MAIYKRDFCKVFTFTVMCLNTVDAWIGTLFFTDIDGAQTMNPNDFDDFSSARMRLHVQKQSDGLL